jgi:xanthine dehydrogenase accessory factor
VSGFDREGLAAALAAGPAVRVLVLSVQGSAPCDAGAAMLVTAEAQSGTIGGGALEWEATAAARALLAAGGPWARRDLRLPLGPALGQCCGGAVRLLLERFVPGAVPGEGAAFVRPLAGGLPPVAADDDSLPLAVRRLLARARDGRLAGPETAAGWVAEPVAHDPDTLMLYGAGHVGRAVVRVLEGLPFRILWVDDRRARFPEVVPAHAEMLVAADPADAVALAGDTARHLVMTYSHPLDLEICRRVLARPFGWLGLIGSASKAGRFRTRLRAAGIGEAALARLVCPIGDRTLGKAPAAIAIGIAAELLRLPADAGAWSVEGVA